MAKKIYLFLCIICVSVLALGLTLNALDLGVEEDFEELVTDKSFMLDSSLFTHEYSRDTYTTPTEDELNALGVSLTEDGFEKIITNENFELWYSSEYHPIRIVNKQTGYVWASDFDIPVEAGEDIIPELKSPFYFTYYREGASTDVKIKSVEDRGVEVETEWDDDTLTYEISVERSSDGVKIKLAFKFEVTLTDAGIEVNLPNNSIKETNCKFGTINLFRYLGSVKGDSVNGYIVVPSGNGGLVRYVKNATTTQGFQTSFYGTDMNYSKTDSSKLFQFPMFGMVHGIGANACLVNIESGDSFATFNYYPGTSGTQNRQLSYMQFSLRNAYEVELNDVDIPRVPDERYTSDIKYSYTFLSGDDADYIGLANEYKNYLIKSGQLVKQELKPTSSVHIEAFGREYENGLIMKKYHNMTTVNDILLMDESLKNVGVTDALYTLKGYYTGGYSGSIPTNVNLESSLGNLDKLENLDYYLYYNPVLSRNSRLDYPSHVLVNMYRLKSYQELEEGKKYQFYTEVPTILEGINKVKDKYSSKVSFDGVTNYLYGDYNNEYTREEVQAEYANLFGDATYPMYAPNVFLLANTSDYLTMDLYHERLIFITDSIPFTQMILRGYMDLYSNYLNFSSNADMDTLRCVEYGVYPSYLITKEASHKLSNTLSNNLYATEFAKVSRDIESQYKFVKGALDNVVGAEIVGREVLGLGIVKVDYSNGKSIVVNYTEKPYQNGALNVESMGYEVVNNG